MERAALALLPLRIFLGGTFVYAGIQKLTDPGFLHPGAPTYIGTQLEGFANGTPGGFLLRGLAIPIPQVAGVGVALTEILIGLLVLAGLYTRIAAAGGMSLNLLLFLTASWHTTPYFLGPDLVFAFAWSPLLIVGSEGQPSVEAILESRRRQSRRAATRTGRPPPLEPALTRRAILAELGGLAVAIAGVSTLLKGRYSAPPALASGKGGAGAGKKARAGGEGHSGGGGEAGASGGSGGEAGSGGGSASGGGSPSGVPANAVRLGKGTEVPKGAGANYLDPVTGTPDILIRSSDGRLAAFSAVCTHAGCTVGYANGVIVCPCHGGEYSPVTGEVIAGPPPTGLEPKRVIEANGELYAIPA
jgi:thiosulfate dehydrogenase [quinone] large subunit